MAPKVDQSKREVRYCIVNRNLRHCSDRAEKVDKRLPGEGNSNSHGARPVHLIIMMLKWIRTSRLSIKNSLSRAWDVRIES